MAELDGVVVWVARGGETSTCGQHNSKANCEGTMVGRAIRKQGTVALKNERAGKQDTIEKASPASWQTKQQRRVKQKRVTTARADEAIIGQDAAIEFVRDGAARLWAAAR